MKREINAVGLGLLALAGCSEQTEQTRPNIVLYLADDIGKECFGCYGSATYHTPNID